MNGSNVLFLCIDYNHFASKNLRKRLRESFLLSTENTLYLYNLMEIECLRKDTYR